MAAVYRTVDEALAIAAENIEARKELARRGLGYVIVAEVRDVAGGVELRAVSVHSEMGWDTTSARHLVLRFDPSTCAVCGRGMTDAGQWHVPGVAGGHFVGGLEPDRCVGCYDTMVAQGIAPIRLVDGKSIEILRPE